jgi:hypothetical protein
MSDRRYDAMRHAVALALSGKFHNWWAVSARLRANRYREADVDWTPAQQAWLDQLCSEARFVLQSQHVAAPAGRKSFLAVIDGGRRRCGLDAGRRPVPARSRSPA